MRPNEYLALKEDIIGGKFQPNQFFKQFYTTTPTDIQKGILEFAQEYARSAPRASYSFGKGEAAISELKLIV